VVGSRGAAACAGEPLITALANRSTSRTAPDGSLATAGQHDGEGEHGDERQSHS
jgi:hypothetical protein